MARTTRSRKQERTIAGAPTHRIPAELLERTVRVMVVGCGGTGSEIVAGLPFLHQALLAFGHPGGLDVQLVDGDVVSEANTVRQTFSRAEIGSPKATALIHRVNAFYGLGWSAVPKHMTVLRRGQRIDADIVIGCVDSRRARAIIDRNARNSRRLSYWLDLGNDASSGQFVLGMPDFLNAMTGGAASAPAVDRLPTVAELFPETIDAARDAADTLPSCSAQEALQRQEPFVNKTIAAHALALLARLFRYGELDHHGGFINLATGKMTPIPVSTEYWLRATGRCAVKADDCRIRQRRSA